MGHREFFFGRFREHISWSLLHTANVFPIHQAFLSNRCISFSETSSQPDAFNPLHSREAKQPWILSGSTRLPLPLSPPFLPRTFFLVSGQTLTSPPSSSSSDLAALSSTSFRSPGLSICFHPLSSSAAALLAFISSPEHRGRERERERERERGGNIIRGVCYQPENNNALLSSKRKRDQMDSAAC